MRNSVSTARAHKPKFCSASFIVVSHGIAAGSGWLSRKGTNLICKECCRWIAKLVVDFSQKWYVVYFCITLAGFGISKKRYLRRSIIAKFAAYQLNRLNWKLNGSRKDLMQVYKRKEKDQSGRPKIKPYSETCIKRTSSAGNAVVSA